MHDVTLTIQLDNVRPEGVIQVNGLECDNAPYVHVKAIPESSIHVKLYYYGQLFHDQLFEMNITTLLVFRAPDVTILNCKTVSGDLYYLNGESIGIPFPVTYFDGAAFEVTRKRSERPDVTITVQPFVGVVDLSSQFDHIVQGQSIDASPQRLTVKSDVKQFDLPLDTEYVSPTNDSTADEFLSENLKLSGSNPLSSGLNGASEVLQRTGDQQAVLPESFRRVIFDNVPNGFDIFVSGRKLSSNQCLVDLASAALPKRYDVRNGGVILGSFPLIMTEDVVTYVHIPEFVRVIGLDYENCRIYINDNLVTIPCWVPVTNRKSIHVRIARESNEFYVERTIPITDSAIDLSDFVVNDDSTKRLQNNRNWVTVSYTTLIHKLSVIQDTLSGRMGFTLLSLFLMMLLIRYAREAPRWLPLALIILMNTLIWMKSTSEAKSSH